MKRLKQMYKGLKKKKEKSFTLRRNWWEGRERPRTLHRWPSSCIRSDRWTYWPLESRKISSPSPALRPTLEKDRKKEENMWSISDYIQPQNWELCYSVAMWLLGHFSCCPHVSAAQCKSVWYCFLFNDFEKQQRSFQQVAQTMQIPNPKNEQQKFSSTTLNK